jgi:hypothetical protein
MSNSLLPITLGEQIAIIDGCEFVGVSDTGEVFVSWHDIDPASKEDAIKLISGWPEVTAVTEVHSISRKQVQAVVGGLNKLLEESEEHINVNCLPGSDTEAGGEAGQAIREFLESYGLDADGSGSCAGGEECCGKGDGSCDGEGDGGCCGESDEGLDTDRIHPKPTHVREKGCGKSSSGHGCVGCKP